MKFNQGLKNNQGFTLIGLLAIAGMLSVVTLSGIAISKYRANQADANQKASDAQQLVANLSGSTGVASVAGSGNLQYQPLANPDPNDLNNPNNPNNPNHPNNPNNPNNPDSPANPNNPNNPANPNFSPPPCASPCHSVTDPDSHVTTCMLTKIDCKCLGTCPIPPAGCVYVDDGPGDPKYQPAPEGGGMACPFVPAPPVCTPPYVISPRYHECRCPGDVSDCTPFGNPPGGLNAPVMNAIPTNVELNN